MAPDGLSEADLEEKKEKGEPCFGDLSETCRPIVRHMQRTQAWLNYRQAYVSTHGVVKAWSPKLDQQRTALNHLMND